MSSFSFRFMVPLACLPTLLLTFSPFVFAQDASYTALDTEAKQIIAGFAKSLKSELTAAIEQGGLEKGVEVCSSRATEIANELSVNGWKLKRVSLKNRQPENAPDEWETSVLKNFAYQKEQGSASTFMYHSEASEASFRAMKAIPTQTLCLACHGEQIAPSVYEVIQKHYPNDKATGYQPGDIRGAFSLEKVIAEITEQ